MTLEPNLLNIWLNGRYYALNNRARGLYGEISDRGLFVQTEPLVEITVNFRAQHSSYLSIVMLRKLPGSETLKRQNIAKNAIL